jgi:hypothetical protein
MQANLLCETAKLHFCGKIIRKRENRQCIIFFSNESADYLFMVSVASVWASAYKRMTINWGMESFSHSHMKFLKYFWQSDYQRLTSLFGWESDLKIGQWHWCLNRPCVIDSLFRVPWPPEIGARALLTQHKIDFQYSPFLLQIYSLCW